MTDNIIQHLISTISDITGYNLSATYAHFYDLIKDIKVKLSVMPPQLLNNIETQIYSIYNIQNKDIKIDSLKGWLIYFYHSPDIVKNIMEDIVPNINICFENENSDKTCEILSNRVIKECKRLYNNFDEFNIANLSLTLSTTSYEGLIKMLKKLKSIVAVNNDIISFEYFINDMINDMLTKC